MKTVLKNPVEYTLPIGDQSILMNELIGKEIKLRFTGKIYDIHDGAPIKKSYAQGYSYNNFIKLAQCDSCIMKPELCHFHEGTCREPSWGEQYCFIPHYIYLAKTSGVKVGITRHTQVPTRWIDQGASEALPILKVLDRKTSGLIEVEIAKMISDKTNWRAMLKGEIEPGPSLEEYREMIFDGLGDLLDDLEAEDLDETPTSITYPLDKHPEKVTAYNLDKNNEIVDILKGIKGQYLIFEKGVINIRKYQGYEIELQS